MTSTQLSGSVSVVAAELFSDSSVKQHNLGELIFSNDGRAFRYVLAGGTALVAGKLQQAPAEITDHQGLTSPVVAVDGTSVAVTLGATAVTANQYAGGYLMVTVTPGVGIQYLISGHLAANASASVTLNLADPIEVALTATSRLDMVLNPYSGVIVNPTTKTSCPVGVGVTVITAAQYGWLQVGGIANILSDGATAVGNFVSPSGSIVGAVIDATHAQEAVVGNAVTCIADTEYGAIKLILM